MKLIALNIWLGKAYEPLMGFLKEHSPQTDIFCLQEVLSISADVALRRGRGAEHRGHHTNIFSDLASLLTDFHGYYAPAFDTFAFEGMPMHFNLSIGQAMFVRKSYTVNSAGSVFIYRSSTAAGESMKPWPANFQYARLKIGQKHFTIANLHGTAYPGTKLDTADRIEQSRRVVKFLREERGAKILCGDFNLLPETKSIQMIEEARMTNLITTYHIATTRSTFSPYYGKEGFQRFADYVLVSPEVNVKRFSVPDVAISDHLPMVLEFS